MPLLIFSLLSKITSNRLIKNHKWRHRVIFFHLLLCLDHPRHKELSLTNWLLDPICSWRRMKFLLYLARHLKNRRRLVNQVDFSTLHSSKPSSHPPQINPKKYQLEKLANPHRPNNWVLAMWEVLVVLFLAILLACLEACLIRKVRRVWLNRSLNKVDRLKLASQCLADFQVLVMPMIQQKVHCSPLRI